MILTSYLNTWMIVLWAIVFVLALIIELITEQLITIWGCGGAFVALILAIFDVKYYWQITVFVAVTGILLLLTKLLYHPKNDKSKTNSDAMIGEDILVTKDITKLSPGEGKFRDIVWTLKVTDDIEIKAGEYATIKEIKGNHLIVTYKVN